MAIPLCSCQWTDVCPIGCTCEGKGYYASHMNCSKVVGKLLPLNLSNKVDMLSIDLQSIEADFFEKSNLSNIKELNLQNGVVRTNDLENLYNLRIIKLNNIQGVFTISNSSRLFELRFSNVDFNKLVFQSSFFIRVSLFINFMEGCVNIPTSLLGTLYGHRVFLTDLTIPNVPVFTKSVTSLYMARVTIGNKDDVLTELCQGSHTHNIENLYLIDISNEIIITNKTFSKMQALESIYMDTKVISIEEDIFHYNLNLVSFTIYLRWLDSFNEMSFMLLPKTLIHISLQYLATQCNCDIIKVYRFLSKRVSTTFECLLPLTFKNTSVSSLSEKKTCEESKCVFLKLGPSICANKYRLNGQEKLSYSISKLEDELLNKTDFLSITTLELDDGVFPDKILDIMPNLKNLKLKNVTGLVTDGASTIRLKRLERMSFENIDMSKFKLMFYEIGDLLSISMKNCINYKVNFVNHLQSLKELHLSNVQASRNNIVDLKSLLLKVKDLETTNNF